MRWDTDGRVFKLGFPDVVSLPLAPDSAIFCTPESAVAFADELFGVFGPAHPATALLLIGICRAVRHAHANRLTPGGGALQSP